MLAFLLRRLALIVPTLFFVSVLIFGLQQLLPGDPAIAIAGEEHDPNVIAFIREKYHLDRPLPVRYALWLGGVLILLFSGELGWLPASGYVSPRENLAANLAAMIMPAFVLGNAIAAVLMRHTRRAMLQVLSSDYVRTARAKGLDERVVVLKHALRNALIPVITLGALGLVALLAPWLSPYDPVATSWSAVRAAPTGAHPFGADELGRDVLARVIWGT